MTDQPRTKEPETVEEQLPSEQVEVSSPATPAPNVADNQKTSQLYSSLQEASKYASRALEQAGVLPMLEGLFATNAGESKATKNSDASLKKELGLPSDSTEQQVNEKVASQNSETFRKALGLPGNASERDVYNKMTADQQAALGKALGNTELIKPVAADGPALRKELGLQADATEKQVDERIAEHNKAALRKGMGMPPDATEKQVYEKMVSQQRYKEDVAWHQQHNPYHLDDNYGNDTAKAHEWAESRKGMTSEQRAEHQKATLRELDATRAQMPPEQAANARDQQEKSERERRAKLAERGQRP